jgi:hypothetical protein
MAVIADSAQIKYAELEQREQAKDSPGRSDYGRFYLQKMVQIQFDLPAARVDAMREVLREDSATGDDAARPKLLSTPRRPSGIKRLGSYARSVVAVVGTVVSLVAASVGIVLAFSRSENSSAVSSSSSTIATVFGLVTVIVTFVAVLVTAIRWIRSYRSREARRRIDQKIREKADNVASSADKLTAEVLRSEAVKGRETLVRQRVQRYLTDESVLREEAESEILKFLPPLPRSAKRMLNHLRVLLTIAVGRDMLGGSPPLEPSHLGKWVVLNERWPELARGLKARPEKLRDFERVTTIEELEESLARLALESEPSADLLRFLNVSPRLAEQVERLVYLEPMRPR